MNLRLGLLVLVVGVTVNNGGVLQARKSYFDVNQRGLLQQDGFSISSTHPAIHSGDRVWLNVKKFLFDKNIRGLFIYLSRIPETQLALDWLEVNYPAIFLDVCWLFDGCKNYDFEIPPEVIQRILQYIYRNDWEGLVAYLKTLEHYELLLDWIRQNFPDAWKEICWIVDPQKC